MVAAAVAVTLGVPIGVLGADDAEAYMTGETAWMDGSTPRQMYDYDNGDTARLIMAEDGVVASPATGSRVMEITFGSERSGEIDINGTGSLQNGTQGATEGSNSMYADASMFDPQVGPGSPAVILRHQANGINTGTASGTGYSPWKVFVRFNYAVTNPVFHIAGLGGTGSSGTTWYSDTAVHTINQTNNPGVTWSNTSNNLTTGNGGTSLQVNASTGQYINPYCNNSYRSELGSVAAGCGSATANGTMLDLVLDVSITKSNNVSGPSAGVAAGDQYNVSVTLPQDVGDAPASYEKSDAATHTLGGVRFGSDIDHDASTIENPDYSPYSVAAGADNTGANGDGADEDAFAGSPPPMSPAAGQYSVTVPLSNTIDKGDVCGWIDFNNDGTFADDAAHPGDLARTGYSVSGTEQACVSFEAGDTSATLTWNNKPATTAGQKYYMRLRAVGSTYDYYTTDASNYAEGDASCSGSPCASGDNYIRRAVAQRQSEQGLGTRAAPQLIYSTGEAYTGEVEDWQVLSEDASDFGDAPSSYGNAEHKLQGYQAGASATGSGTSNLMIGQSVDSEAAQQPSSDAWTGGDDPNGGPDDEDGVFEPNGQDAMAGAAPHISLSADATTYSMTIPVTNTSGTSATLAGWLDVDRSGTFDTDERATVTVPAGATSATLTWTLPGDVTPGSDYTFARFRIAPGTAIPAATGTITGGEVEDHKVTITGTPALSLDKTSQLNDVDGDAKADVGETITYRFLVTNTGSTTMSNITVNDDKLTAAGATVSCPATSLAPGTSTTCTGTYTVTQADLNDPSGMVINTATAQGTPPGSTTPTTTPPDTTQTPTDRRRAITIDKSHTTAFDTDGSGGANIGETIDYTFLVTNTGTVALSDVYVTDAKMASAGATITCPQTTLQPGQSTTCTARYPVTAADMNAASIVNTATATGTGPSGTTVTSTPDNDTVPTTRNAALTIVKTGVFSTDGGEPGLGDVGDQVTYTFQVTNTGTVPLTSVTVNDPRLTAAGVPVTCTPTTLNPNEVATCRSGPYTVTGDDIAAGSITNTATSTGTPPPGVTPPVSPPDDVVLPVNDSAALTLVKDGTLVDQDGDGAADVGETIDYVFDVTNAGAQALNTLTVTDSMLTAAGRTITCAKTTLAAGETVQCTASYTVTQADVDRGSIPNVAQAHARTLDPDGSGPLTSEPVDSNEDDDVVYPADQTASIALEKRAVLNDAVGSTNQLGDLNETIDYYFDVTNTGNVTLTNLSITDPELTGVDITCPTAPLAPGASTTCWGAANGDYQITQADVDAGQVNNVATAHGTPPDPAPYDPDGPGGNPPIDPPAPPPVDSPPDTTTVPTNKVPSLTLVKQGTLTDTDGNGRSEAGDTIAYTFRVTNDGTTTVNGLTVVDPKVGLVTCAATTLAPGGYTDCTAAPYTVTQADVNKGEVVNVAVANGRDPDNQPVISNEDDHVEPLSDYNAITLVKTATLANANGSMKDGAPSADAGEVITFRFRVTNTGDQTLSNITIDDAMLAGLTPPVVPTCPTTPLAPGASATCSAAYTVTQADVNAGLISNVATAEGTPPDPDPDDGVPPTPVPSEPDDTVTPTNQTTSLTLDKSAAHAGSLGDTNRNNLADLGETITYTFTVTNTGTVPVTGVTINDPRVTNAVCTPTGLAPGQSATCTGTYVVTLADTNAGRVVNTATATATPPPDSGLTPPTSPPDTTETPANGTPGLTLVKTGTLSTDANGNLLANVGDVVTYTFKLTNTGQVSLTTLRVSDSKVGAVTCPQPAPPGLAPGASVDCTAQYTVTQADIAAKAVLNTATAYGTPPSGPEVPSDPDDHVVPVDYDPELTLVKTGERNQAGEQNYDGNLDAGETVDYTFTVTNTGTVHVQNITVNDPKLAAQTSPPVTITCLQTALNPGASTTCTATGYVVTQADANAYQVKNTATAVGSTGDPQDDPVVSNPDDHLEPVVPEPSLTLVKTAVLTNTNGSTVPAGQVNAGAATADVGEVIGYEFLVTNDGDITLTNIQIADPMLVASKDTVTCPKTPLAPGASMTCTAKYDVTATDVANGSIANTATASGQPPVEPDGDVPPRVPSNPDDTIVPANTTPSATLDKTSTLLDKDGDARADKGEQIQYRFAIKNTGTVPLTNLRVDDDRLAQAGLTATCPTTALAPGATATCTATYTVTQSDVDNAVVGTVDLNGDGVPDQARVIPNEAIAYGTAPNGEEVPTNEDTTVTPVDDTAAATLDKSAQVLDAVTPVAGTAQTVPGNGDGQADVGEQVSYKFLVRNTGKVTLTDPQVNDQMLSDAGVDVTCPVIPEPGLAPNATVTCTAVYTVTQADVNRRKIENTATVTLTTPSDTPVTTPPDTTVVTPGYHPAVSLVKDGVLGGAGGLGLDRDGDGLADATDEIDYIFRVTNTGNVPLDPVTVSDPKLAAAGIAITCPAGPLAPGQTVECNTGLVSYVVTQSDVDGGPIRNRAVATGVPPADPNYPNLPPTPVDSPPALDEVPVDDDPAMTLEKTVRFVGTANDLDGDGLGDLGENLVFDFLVTNTGGTTISGVRVDDPMLAALGITPVCPLTVLPPGRSTTCTATYTVRQADVDAGSVANVATAKGTAPDPDGPDGPNPPPPVVTPPDDTNTPTDDTPALSLAKTSTLNDEDGDGLADKGETIGYVLTATNTGATTLTDVVVRDDMLAAAGITPTCPSNRTLAPGAELVCTATYTVTQADVEAGRVVNHATATGKGPDPDGPDGPEPPPDVPAPPVETTTPSDDTPALTLVKTGTLEDLEEKGFANVGETIRYTFDVTNTGAVPLKNVGIDDSMFSDAQITCPDTSVYPLDVGQTLQCVATHVVTLAEVDSDAGMIRNVATAEGTPPDKPSDPTDPNSPLVPSDPVVSPPDDVEVPITSTTGLTVVKNGVLNDADGDGLGDLGETIAFTFTVTNTGERSLTGITVDDPTLAAAGIAVTCPAVDLPPYLTGQVAGANVMTCTAATPYTLTQADVDAGRMTNVATAEGTTIPPGDPVITPPTEDNTPTDNTPNVGIVKTATLHETAGVVGDGKAEAGDTVDYAFVVTNTGKATLESVSVTDEMLSALPAPIAVTCDALPAGGLAPGASVNCAAVAPYTVTLADVEAGVIHNVATASGVPSDPPPVDPDGPGPIPPYDPPRPDPDGPGPLQPGDPVTSPPDDEDVITLSDASLELVKGSTLRETVGVTTDGLAEAGDTIDYTFTVTNTGTVTVTDVVVNDPMLAGVNPAIVPVCPVTTLAPGASTVCTAAPYTVTQEDVAAGAVLNEATASGKGPDPDGPDGPKQPPTVPSDPDEERVPAKNTPELTLEKTVADATDEDPQVAALGETLRYSFLVTNTGTVPMTDIRISDEMLAAAYSQVTCPIVQLDPGESTTCTASYVTTLADVQAGSVNNVATALGKPPEGTDPDGPDGPLQPGDDPDNGPEPDPDGDGPLPDPDDGPGKPGEVPSNPDDTTVPTDEPATGLVMQKVAMLLTEPLPALAEEAADSLCERTDSGGNPVMVRCDALALTPTELSVLTGDPDALCTRDVWAAGAAPGDPPTATGATTQVPCSSLTAPGGVPMPETVGDQDGDGLADVGDEIVFAFVVQNTGEVPLTGITVDDPMLDAVPLDVTCPDTSEGGNPGPLAPGAQAWCYSEPYVVTGEDIGNGVVQNVATATSDVPPDSPPGTEPPVTPPSRTDTPVDPNPAITLDKAAVLTEANGVTDDGKAEADDTIAYTFTVKNTGNMDMMNVRVIDDMLSKASPVPPITCAPAGTAAGALATVDGDEVTLLASDVDLTDDGADGPYDGGEVVCTATYTVTEADVARGSVDNLAIAAGTPFTEDPENPGVRTPIPTDPDDGPLPDPDGDGPLPDPDNGPLQPGEDPDGPDGPLQPNEVPSDPDEEHVPTNIESSVALVKGSELVKAAGNTGTLAEVGDTIEYAFTVTNTGTVPVDTIRVNDPMLAAANVPVTCPALPGLADLDLDGDADDPALMPTDDPATTAVNENAVVCTATYTVTQADVDKGVVYNSATATGRGPDPDGPGGNPPPTTPPSDPDDEIVITERDPEISLEKTATLNDLDGDGLADLHETITYGFVVTNTGNTTLTNPRVVDEKLAAQGITVTCAPDPLAPREFRSCLASKPYEVTQADVDRGSVLNVATPYAIPPTPADPDGPGPSPTPPGEIPGEPGKTNTPTDDEPKITLVKSSVLNDEVTNDDLAQVGETITFTFTVTNSGNTTLNDVEIDDPMLAAVSPPIEPVCQATTLAPAARTTCTATYTVTQADVDRGRVFNEATAEGTPPPQPSDPTEPDDPTENPPVPRDPVESPPDETETPSDYKPYLALEKTAVLDNQDDDDNLADVGETITFTFTLTNRGTTTLENLSVADPMLAAAVPAVTIAACTPTTLAPGEAATCTSSPYTVTQDDVDAGGVYNLAVANGETPPTDPDGPRIDPPPFDPDGPDGPLPPIDPAPPTTPGDPVEVPSNPDETETPSDINPELTLVKDARLIDGDGDGLADNGEQIEFTFTITNTGDITLEGVRVDDPMLASVSPPIVPVCQATTLAPDEATTCTALYTVRQADINNGSVHNVATAEGTPPDPDGPDGPRTPPDPDGPEGPKVPGDPVESPPDETDTPSDLKPNIKVDKTARLVDADGDNLADAGETIEFSFQVVNTGNVILHDVTVSDPMLAEVGLAITCPVTTLAPGAATVCTAPPYLVRAEDVGRGLVFNVATATGTPPDGPPETPGGPPVPSDPVDSPPDTTETPADSTPKLDLVKSAELNDVGEDDDLAQVGETIDFTFHVTNTGNTRLDAVRVVDPMLAAAGVTPVCPVDVLEIGQSTDCTATYTVTQADVDKGQVFNVATAQGTPPDPEPFDPDGPDGPQPPIDPPPADPDGPGPKVPGDPVDSPPDDTKTPTDSAPELTLDKAADLADGDGDELADVGETIAFTFTVTNTGTTTVRDVEVDDPLLDAAGVTVTCPVTTLAPGQQTVCTSTAYTVTQADVDRGRVFNYATAIGTPPDPPPYDPDGPGPQPPIDPPPLDPDGPDGPKEPGDPVETPPDTTETPTDYTPAMTVVKDHEIIDDGEYEDPSTGDGADGLADVGEHIEYTFTVTNTGTTTLSAVAIDDPLLTQAGITAIPCATTTLAPGEATTCTTTYPVRQVDVDTGFVLNVATANGKPPTQPPYDPDGPGGNPPITPEPYDPPPFDPEPFDPDGPDGPLPPIDPPPVDPGPGDPIVTPPDDELVESDVDPGAELVKTATLADQDGDALADAGEKITYTFTVTNTGTTTLENVTVEDDLLTELGLAPECDTTTLVPAAAATCTATYTVTAADVVAGGVENVATAQGDVPEPPPIDPDGPDGPLPPIDPPPLDPDGPDGPKEPGDPVETPPDDTFTPADPNPKLVLVKEASLADADDDGLADPGEEITFSFTVTNVGATRLTNVAVVDPVLADAGITVTCPAPAALEPGEFTVCTSSPPYVVTEADVARGSVYNVATAKGTGPQDYDPPPYDPDGPDGPLPPVDPAPGEDPDGPGPADPGEVPSPPDDTSTPTDPVPSLSIDKAATLDNANGDTDADGRPLADEGETITFAFTVTNTGKTRLENVAVSDPLLAAAGVTVTCPVTALDAGQQTVCTSTPYAVTRADVARGTVYNVATATGTPFDPPPYDPDGDGPLPPIDPPPADPDGPGPKVPGDPVDSPPDHTDTPSNPAPELTVEKSASLADDDGDGLADPGEILTFTFTATNTGNVRLTGVAIKDAMLAAASPPIVPACATTTLEPDAATTCTATYRVQAADVLSGRVYNVATAVGTPPDPEPYDPDGPDGPLPPVDPPAPDPDGPGPKVPGDPVESPPDETITPTDLTPGIMLDKKYVLVDGDNDGLADTGEIIRYSFTVTNSGPIPIEQLTVNDPMLAATGAPIRCPAITLEPGDAADCGPVEYRVTAADVATGGIYNVATAAGRVPKTFDPDGPDGPWEPGDPDGPDGPMTPETPVPSNPDDVEVPSDLKPELTLEKKSALDDANGNGYAEAGERIRYTFTVTNTGNANLDTITVDDPMLAAAGVEVTCPAGMLVPGASRVCGPVTYTVEPADVEAGRVYNVATAHGVPPDPDGPDGPRTPPDPDGPGPKVPGDPVDSDPDDTETPAGSTSSPPPSANPSPNPSSGPATYAGGQTGPMPRTGAGLVALWVAVGLLGAGGAGLLGARSLRPSAAAGPHHLRGESPRAADHRGARHRGAHRR